MHPELAVAVGRHFQSADRHRAHACFVGADQDGAGVGDEPQHLHGQRRHQHILRLHDHRYAAHDAVAFRVDGEQSASGGSLLDRRHVAQQSGKGHQKRPRIGAANGEAGLQRRLGIRSRRDDRRAGFADDDYAGALDRVGEHHVVAGKAVEFLSRLRVDATETGGGYGRRHAIGLGKHDVEADGDRAHFAELGDKIGDDSPRPRPLADFLQARLVDIGDDDRMHRLHPRAQHLKEIESAQMHFFQRSRIGDPQRHQRQQEQDAHRACDAEPPRPADDALHDLTIPAPDGFHYSKRDRSYPAPRLGMRDFYLSRNARVS